MATKAKNKQSHLTSLSARLVKSIKGSIAYKAKKKLTVEDETHVSDIKRGEEFYLKHDKAKREYILFDVDQDDGEIFKFRITKKVFDAIRKAHTLVGPVDAPKKPKTTKRGDGKPQGGKKPKLSVIKSDKPVSSTRKGEYVLDISSEIEIKRFTSFKCYESLMNQDFGRFKVSIYQEYFIGYIKAKDQSTVLLRIGDSKTEFKAYDIDNQTLYKLLGGSDEIGSSIFDGARLDLGGALDLFSQEDHVNSTYSNPEEFELAIKNPAKYGDHGDVDDYYTLIFNLAVYGDMYGSPKSEARVEYRDGVWRVPINELPDAKMPSESDLAMAFRIAGYNAEPFKNGVMHVKHKYHDTEYWVQRDLNQNYINLFETSNKQKLNPEDGMATKTKNNVVQLRSLSATLVKSLRGATAYKAKRKITVEDDKHVTDISRGEEFYLKHDKAKRAYILFDVDQDDNEIYKFLIAKKVYDQLTKAHTLVGDVDKPAKPASNGDKKPQGGKKPSKPKKPKVQDFKAEFPYDTEARTVALGLIFGGKVQPNGLNFQVKSEHDLASVKRNAKKAGFKPLSSTKTIVKLVHDDGTQMDVAVKDDYVAVRFN